MIETLQGFEFTSLMGLVLYWVPMIVCLVVYAVRTWENYQKDVAAREEAENSDKKWYNPTDTVGTLIGRFVASVCPFVNVLAAIFDTGPKMLRRIFSVFEDVFDKPLVPKRKIK